MGKNWSDEEVTFLSEKCNTFAHQEMAAVLGRTASAVNHKIQKLGLAKKNSGSRASGGFKKCSRCKKIKSIEVFNNNCTRLDGKETWCKKCLSIARKLMKYEISEESYYQKIEDQHGRCAICGQIPDFFCLDHDHTSGQVRGLLCNLCNIMIGACREDVRILASAILYLRQYGKTTFVDNEDFLTGLQAKIEGFKTPAEDINKEAGGNSGSSIRP